MQNNTGVVVVNNVSNSESEHFLTNKRNLDHSTD